MTYDILGLGCATVDDLLYVDSYPPPDTKTRILRSERQCGGLTATALVAAARFGAKCAYAGQLGNDDQSTFVDRALRAEGIDTLVHAAASLKAGRHGAQRGIPTRAEIEAFLTSQTR
jgi:sugar/nucleoside kinase (ribokinase family)